MTETGTDRPRIGEVILAETEMIETHEKEVETNLGNHPPIPNSGVNETRAKNPGTKGHPP